MTQLRSRLAQRLEAEIAAWATLPGRVAGLQVQRCLLLARHGREQEARTEMGRLYQRSLVQPRAELTAWLHLAEGVLAFYAGHLPLAHLRVQRAQDMAEAAGVADLLPWGLAWRAHLEVVARRPALVAAAAQQALACPQADAGVRYRAATAVALAWSVSQDPVAVEWFTFARQQCLIDGDDAALAALLYNQTQVRALRIRIDALRGRPGEAPSALLSVDSVSHFDAAVGGTARSELTPLVRAQLLLVQGQVAEARRVLESQLPALMAAGLSHIGHSLLADLAWCCVEVGETARARALAESAALELRVEAPDGCDIEDRAAAHARLADVHQRLGEQDSAARHRAAAEQAWVAFDQHRADWVLALEAAGLRALPAAAGTITR